MDCSKGHCRCVLLVLDVNLPVCPHFLISHYLPMCPCHAGVSVRAWAATRHSGRLLPQQLVFNASRGRGGRWERGIYAGALPYEGAHRAALAVFATFLIFLASSLSFAALIQHMTAACTMCLHAYNSTHTSTFCHPSAYPWSEARISLPPARVDARTCPYRPPPPLPVRALPNLPQPIQQPFTTVTNTSIHNSAT